MVHSNDDGLLVRVNVQSVTVRFGLTNVGNVLVALEESFVFDDKIGNVRDVAEDKSIILVAVEVRQNEAAFHDERVLDEIESVFCKL